MTAWRIVRGKEFVTKDSSNTDNKRGDNWSENFFKNSVGKPSGPGDLPLCMAPIADIISLTEKFLSSSAESSSLTEGIFRDLKKSSKTEGFVEASDVYNNW